MTLALPHESGGRKGGRRCAVSGFSWPTYTREVAGPERTGCATPERPLCNLQGSWGSPQGFVTKLTRG